MSSDLFTKPDLFQAKRVLAVQPHYDDNDIAAGGTLANLAAGGAEIFYLTVTDDLVGVVDQSLSEADMLAGLKADLDRAGKIIGIKDKFWLGYPDAGQYDYFDLRLDVIQYIRELRPDFVMTCDPWTPYEFHNDHIMTGKAATAAANLYDLLRLATDPAVDRAYESFELQGIAFYASAHPNTVVDISETWAKKREAVKQYRMQFAADEMENLLRRLEMWAKHEAKDATFSHAERLKVMHSWQLHVFPDAWKV
ncbi:MAG: PIG-L deacetylase family protein [Candidatus Promineifilaceae bacterium]|nr:PIG-L deacetylase family protein [Candidatus Promineifilaceae bacterium]